MEDRGTSLDEALPARLRALRTRLGLSQEQLAQRLGVSFATVNRWETGRTSISRRAAGLVDALERRATPTGPGGDRTGGDGTQHRPSPVPADDHLPAPQSSFVGRRAELDELADLVARHRLVTLTGPGGAGKTRLSIEVARRHPGDLPVAFVALEPRRHAADLATAVAAALGVRDEPEVDTGAAVAAALRTSPRLVVLDGAEHLRDEVAELVVAVLEAAPEARILVTSRRLLGAAGEVAWAVPALRCPIPSAADDDVVASDAVTLLLARSCERLPSFDARPADPHLLGELCRQLDGLPLAIELIAGWIGTLSFPEILERRQALLSGGGAPTGPGRTLDAVILHSWQLLGPVEQALLPVLSIFAGAFTLDDAGQVSGLDDRATAHGLRGLVDSSWLSVQVDGDRNRFLLLESMRHFAADRLVDVGTASDVAKAHAVHFATLAARSESALAGPDTAAWVRRMNAGSADVERALQWAEAAEETDVGLAMGATLWRWWLISGRLAVGRGWLATFLVRAGGRRDAIVARAQSAAALLAAENGDYRSAVRQGLPALRTLESLGEQEAAALAATVLGSAHRYLGEHGDARRYFETAMQLRRQLGDRRGVSVALNNLALVAIDGGDLPGARALFEESIALKRELGDPRSVAIGLANLADVLIRSGAGAQAGVALEEAAGLAEAIDNPQLIATLRCNQGDLAASVEEWEVATGRYRAGLDAYRRAGHPHGVALALLGLGRTLTRLGQTDEAIRHLREAEAVASSHGNSADASEARLALEAATRPDTPLPAGITARQADVLRLLASGASNKEIAHGLHLSVATVERHLATVYRNLSLRGRVEAARWALAHGLVAPRR